MSRNWCKEVCEDFRERRSLHADWRLLGWVTRHSCAFRKLNGKISGIQAGKVVEKKEGVHIMKRLCALTILVAGSAMAVAMMANWPPSIVGTWQGVANQSNVKLVITNQGATGACKSISGTLSNVPSGGESNVQGFYCPATGRVSFVRKDMKSNATFQSYS